MLHVINAITLIFNSGDDEAIAKIKDEEFQGKYLCIQKCAIHAVCLCSECYK